MTQDPVLLSFAEISLHARQFGTGAILSASEAGATIVIDVFRASNTMLELMNAGGRVRPVMTIGEVRKPEFNEYLRVGEDHGKPLPDFHFDNSPVQISQNKDKVRNRDVVFRTTNGTRGILSALGSKYIIVGTFRNFSAVIDHLVDLRREYPGLPISFVAMGTLEEYRIEDAYCAQMFVIRMLQKLGREDLIDGITNKQMNPFERDWRAEIMEKRGENTYALEDYRFSLEMDKTSHIPIYNPNTGFLELIN